MAEPKRATRRPTPAEADPLPSRANPGGEVKSRAAGAFEAVASKFRREPDPASPTAHSAYHDLVVARQGHPDPIDLTDFALERTRLAAATIADIERHLDHCDECRSEVAELQAHPEYYGATATACD